MLIIFQLMYTFTFFWLPAFSLEGLSVNESFASASPEILFRELADRQIALRHYVHYLKEMGEQRLLVELLK